MSWFLSGYKSPFCPLSCAHHWPRHQDKIIDDDAFVELAQCCARACLVLRTVTEGGGVGGLSEPAREAIETLEKYDNSTQLSPWSSITNITRTIHRIQIMVAEHVPGDRSFPEHHPGSTEMSPVLWKARLQEILEIIDVRDCNFGLPQFLTYLSGVWRQRVPPRLAKITSAHSPANTPPSPIVVRCLSLRTPLLLTVPSTQATSVFSIGESLATF